MTGAVVSIKADIGRFNGDFSNATNSITGINTQIGEQLIKLGRIDTNLPQIGGWSPGDINIFPNKPLKYLQHPGDAMIQIKHPRRCRLLAGKSQQLPGHLR